MIHRGRSFGAGPISKGWAMLVRPASSFISNALGYPVTMTEADILEDTHPHVRANPKCFVEVRPTIVEEATANPGEKRHVSRQG